MYFEYGEKEIEYLKSKDRRLGEVIDRVGKIDRAVSDDLFSSVVNNIVGQQISTKAHVTIWNRMKADLGEINAETLLGAGAEKLQSYGISFRKADYITDFAKKVHSGEFDIESLYHKTDEEVIRRLSALKGIGGKRQIAPR